MNFKTLTAMLCALATLALSACGKVTVSTYRYKLSLEVETPAGVKRGFMRQAAGLSGRLPKLMAGQGL